LAKNFSSGDCPAHGNGELDSVTAHFKEILETNLGKKRVKVFDFQFDQKTPYNSFDLVLGAVIATKGEIFVPGDSTSMISEAIDTMAPQRVIVYENSAMNEVHHSHIASEFKAGRAAILKEDQTVTGPLSTSESVPSAARVIAGRLWDDMCI
jgi:mitochondrial fission protein ELM1